MLAKEAEIGSEPFCSSLHRTRRGMAGPTWNGSTGCWASSACKRPCLSQCRCHLGTLPMQGRGGSCVVCPFVWLPHVPGWRLPCCHVSHVWHSLQCGSERVRWGLSTGQRCSHPPGGPCSVYNGDCTVVFLIPPCFTAHRFHL